MSRVVKFRGWHTSRDGGFMLQPGDMFGTTHDLDCCRYFADGQPVELMQFTGVKDMEGNDIFFDDILIFADKWEWYRGSYGIRMHFATPEARAVLQAEYDAEPYETRVVKDVTDYEWLLSGDISQYWKVVGNIHESPELLEAP